MSSPHNFLYNFFLACTTPRPAPVPGGTINVSGECGAYFELAAGTYAVANATPPAWFWAKATGAVTLTGAATMSTGEIALVVADSTSSWSAHVFSSAGDDFAATLQAAVAASALGDAGTAILLGFNYSHGGGYFSVSADTIQTALEETGAWAALPNSKFTTRSAGSETAAAGHLTGARFVAWKNTANGAVAITTRSAAQMYNDLAGTYPAGTLPSFVLRIISGGDNTVTLTASGTPGVTITGTATAATGKFRDFLCTFTSASALTIQDSGGN